MSKSKKAPVAIRGSRYSTILILESLIRGEKITNHEVAKFHTNSVKDIIGDLRRNYGLEIADIRVKTKYQKDTLKDILSIARIKRRLNTPKVF